MGEIEEKEWKKVGRELERVRREWGESWEIVGREGEVGKEW